MSDPRYVILSREYIIPTYTLPELLYKLPECVSEYPIEASGYLLLECSKNKDLWYVKNISGK